MKDLFLQDEGTTYGSLAEEAGSGGPVLGDGWQVEPLFPEGLACRSLLCMALVALDGTGRV